MSILLPLVRLDSVVPRLVALISCPWLLYSNWLPAGAASAARVLPIWVPALTRLLITLLVTPVELLAGAAVPGVVLKSMGDTVGTETGRIELSALTGTV